MFQPKKLWSGASHRHRAWTTADGTQKSTRRPLEWRHHHSHFTDDYHAWRMQFECQCTISRKSKHLTSQGQSKAARSSSRLTLCSIQRRWCLSFTQTFSIGTSPARLKPFESPQPLPHCWPLAVGIFHHSPVSAVQRLRKYDKLYMISQASSVNSTRYQRGWSRSCVMCSPQSSQPWPMHRLHKVVSQTHKHAIVHPGLKKSSLDPTDIKSYRPISTLSFVSKTVERLVVNQLAAHANLHTLLLVCQSAYRQQHST